jgi:hypothetical protein
MRAGSTCVAPSIALHLASRRRSTQAPDGQGPGIGSLLQLQASRNGALNLAGCNRDEGVKE